MTSFMMVLSTLLASVATVAIAYFTKKNIALTKSTLELAEATHELNKAIKESSNRYQDDMKKLQIALTAAQLYAGSNPPGKPLSTQKLDEFRKIVTNDL